MATLLQVNDSGEAVRDAAKLPARRRKLSTVMKQADLRKRPHIVTIQRAADIRAMNLDALRANDDNTIPKSRWKDVTVGPQDVVTVIYLPMGGMGGGKGGGKNIGMILGMLLLAVVAPMISGALGGVMGSGFLGKLVTTGLLAGLQYFMGQANKPKSNKSEERPVYGISGGGNVPRPGDRIPVHYGRTWINPDLSQPDYFYYANENNGEEQVLLKRMTIGMGHYEILTIRVGQSILWKDGAFREPFEDSQIDIIEPNSRSSLVPSAVYSSDQVNGMELIRPDDPGPEDNVGPFVVVPVGETTKRIQLDYSFPQGLYASKNTDGTKVAHLAGAVFEYTTLNADNQPTNNWKSLYVASHQLKSTRAARFTRYVDVPEGRYAVRARSLQPREYTGSYTRYDTITWDGLRSWLDKEPRRPGITELGLKVKSGPSTGNVPFSDVWVEVSRKLPTWNGTAWTAPIVTRKAVWAALDILHNSQYGAGAPDGNIDLARFFHYAATVTENDTCDGTIRGPVSVLEALNTVLGTVRAEASYVGGVWSLTRDEPRTARKHLITRRQIVKDTTGIDYDLDLGDGASDVIVEYFVGGDPKKRNEDRVTIGVETNTPRRIALFGVTTFKHAHHLAKWYAAVAYWRRQNRQFTTEHLGRNMLRNDPALVEAWFLDETQAAGVDTRSGYTIKLDATINFPAGAHAVFRNEKGLEWGPVGITPVDGRTFTVSASDAAVIEGWTGQSFASLFSRLNKVLPMTVMIGTLAATTDAYLIRSARFTEEGHVEISAVKDADEVWNILGEQPPPDPPIQDVVAEEGDLLPIIPYLKAEIVQKATALTVEWVIGITRGAVGYIVDIRYGTESSDQWERIYNGPHADGDHVIDYRSDTPELRIRAYAYNAKGVLSKPVFTTATMFKPVISGEIADMLIELEMLQGQVRRDIQAINDIGENTLREGLKKLEERLEEVASAAATVAGNEYEARELFKVVVGDAFAAIKREESARVDGDAAVVEFVELMTASWANGAIEAAILRESEARAAADGALARDMLVMRAEIGSDVTAALVEERNVTANRIEGAKVEVTETMRAEFQENYVSLTEYSSTVAGPGGLKAQWGIAIQDNLGPLGGVILTGARKLDGSPDVRLGVQGDLIVDGTIFGTKLAAASIITGSAQINNAVINSAHIQTAAITNAKIGTAEIDTLHVRGRSFTSAYFTSGSIGPSAGYLNLNVPVRAGGEIVIIATVYGGEVSALPQERTVSVYLDNVLIQSFVLLEVVGDRPYTIGATRMYNRSNPSNATRTISVRCPVAFGGSVLGLELAR